MYIVHMFDCLLDCRLSSRDLWRKFVRT